MTFCVGWIDRGCVFLVADALAIRNARSVDQFTSFGQLNQQVLRGHSEECLIKVVPLSKHIAAAGAGNLGTISRALSFLRETVGYLSIQECVARLHMSAGPFSDDDDAELVIAAYIDGTPTLIGWNSLGEITTKTAGVLSCGSLNQSLVEMPTKMIEEIAKTEEAPIVRLLAVISSLQSLGVHQDTVSQGVGGAFHGLFVDSEGYKWQPDTRFIIYGPIQSSTWATTAIRGDALLVHFKGTSGPYCFLSTSSNKDWKVWASEWFVSSSKLMSSDDFNFWVFISRKWMFTTIVYWHPESGECRFFRLQRDESGALDLFPTVAFAEYLEQLPPEIPAPAIPFAVSILNGEVQT